MTNKAIGYNRNVMSIGDSKIKAIKLADDQAVVSGLTKVFQEMVNKINCTYVKQINVSKTKTRIEISMGVKYNMLFLSIIH